jgi:cbb3-type cytochrome oxidase subunit 3
MKLVRHYLESIEGVAIFQIIPLIIFFVFFIAVIWYVIKMKKEDVQRYSNIPLNNDEVNGQIKKNN